MALAREPGVLTLGEQRPREEAGRPLGPHGLPASSLPRVQAVLAPPSWKQTARRGAELVGGGSPPPGAGALQPGAPPSGLLSGQPARLGVKGQIFWPQLEVKPHP